MYKLKYNLNRTIINRSLATLVIIVMLLLGKLWTEAQDLNNPFSSNLVTIRNDNLGQLQPLDIAEDVQQISFSPNSLMVAIAEQTLDANFVVIIASIDSNELIDSIQGQMVFFEELVWSPDSERIAIISSRRTGGGVENYTITTYTVGGAGNGDAILSLDYPATLGDTPIDFSWHPIEDLIAVGFSNELTIFDATTSEIYTTLSIPNILNVNWVNNGSVLLVETDNDVLALGIIAEN